jgi:phage FluMu protein Com
MKPAGRDTRFERAVAPMRGWNPLMPKGSNVEFRCGMCGCLLSVRATDMMGECEVKCPVCGHVHVINRRPDRWGSKPNQKPSREMMMSSQEIQQILGV